MENTISQKFCSRCKTKKPVTGFYPGMYWCKACRKEYSKERNQASKPNPNPRLIQCSQCKVKKRLLSFATGYNKETPVCTKCERKTLPLVQRKSQRAKSLKYAYGITEDEYEDMFIRQFGLCAICGKPPKDGRRLHVDHCHTSGINRGLLCLQCNHLLGNARDDIPTLQKAIAYLDLHNS